jgi:hypothetical protein
MSCRGLFRVVVPLVGVHSIRDGKLYDYNLRRTVEDFTAFAEGAYAKVEAKEIPAGALSPLFLLVLLLLQ